MKASPSPRVQGPEILLANSLRKASFLDIWTGKTANGPIPLIDAFVHLRDPRAHQRRAELDRIAEWSDEAATPGRNI
ncbi:hypothetical protein RBA41_12835 [Massilia sp. CCM 9210]|uniref:hypothetical protein n=1 Tax=Massilia scottii TaxID=3057166 RepID=UPI002796B540|nr:hypothetical protein [Massilia sp. CCM 9210]MDQ1814193.1 hypothetical protein [Massilia sp. CCM 9210]